MFEKKKKIKIHKRLNRMSFFLSDNTPFCLSQANKHTKYSNYKGNEEDKKVNIKLSCFVEETALKMAMGWFEV